MIAIVDTGGANIASVRNALSRIGSEGKLTVDPREIKEASHVILPGVGAAGDSMRRLSASGLVDCVKRLKQPVLGICLGMQLLFESSEEGDTPCLGLLPGVVRRLKANAGFPVPHMGWNQVTFFEENALTRGIAPSEYFYFVHSYAAPESPWTTGRCEYREYFPVMVNRGNFFGVQFHPERSARAGSKLLRNFLSL